MTPFFRFPTLSRILEDRPHLWNLNREGYAMQYTKQKDFQRWYPGFLAGDNGEMFKMAA